MQGECQWLPLHCAARCTSTAPETLRKVLDAHPEAIREASQLLLRKLTIVPPNEPSPPARSYPILIATFTVFTAI